MTTKETNKEHVTCMRNAFSAAYDFMETVEKDADFKVYKEKVGRRKDFSGKNLAKIREFVAEARAETNMDALDIMIREYVRKEDNFEVMKNGISCELLIDANNKGYGGVDDGIFDSSSKNSTSPLVLTIVKNKSAEEKMTKGKLSYRPYNFPTFFSKIITGEDFTEDGEAVAVKSKASRSKPKESEETEIPEKFLNYLSKLNSYFYFYFAKSIVTYLTNYQNPNDPMGAKEIILKHTFCANTELKKPNFGNTNNEVMMQKLLANSGLFTEALNYAGYNVGTEEIKKGITKMAKIVNESSNIIQHGGSIEGVLPLVASLIKDANNMFETTNIEKIDPSDQIM
jgi:hypothetical protein